MAGPVEPEPKPDLGWKATVAGLVFAAAILVGFGAATAASYDGDKDKYDDHGEEYGDDHGDEYDDDDHGDDEDHSDE